MKNARFRSIPFLFAWCWFLGLANFGCGQGLHQDPLEGEPEEIRRRLPPARRGVGTEALGDLEELVKIENAENYTFKEGVAGKVLLMARVLTPINGHTPVLGQDYEYVIENLGDFPGATFDRASGTFAWTPPLRFVQDEFTRYAHLDVRLITTGEPRLERRKTIALTVTRAQLDPEVLEVEDLASVPTREGEARKFRVLVSDPEAQNAENKRPRLLVVANKRGGRNGAHMVSLAEPAPGSMNPEPLPGDQTKWIFFLELDVEDREVTKGAELFEFALVAVSRFGRSSAPKAASALVWTRVEEPVISWEETVPVIAGEENVFSFSVFDPKGEGKVTAQIFRCDLLPGSASCSCREQRNGALELCTVRWKVAPEARLGEYELEGEMLNQSRVKGDPSFQRKTFRRSVRVLPSPHVPPARPANSEPRPEPNPAPGPEASPSPTPAPASAAGPSSPASASSSTSLAVLLKRE